MLSLKADESHCNLASKKANICMERQTERQKDRKTERQKDRKTEKQKERRKDGKTN